MYANKCKSWNSACIGKTHLYTKESCNIVTRCWEVVMSCLSQSILYYPYAQRVGLEQSGPHHHLIEN